MRGVFNLDGPVFSALSRLADLVILNLLFLVCCIPVFTIGASLSALSYVLLKIQDEREGYIIRTFFRGFKQNFKQATLCWLILMAAGAVLLLDTRMINSVPGFGWMRVVILLGAILWLMITIYIFPLIARFVNTTGNMFRNALLIALANAPKTMVMIVILIAAGFVVTLNATAIAYGILFWFVIGFSLVGWIYIKLMYKIFERLTPPEEETREEDAIFHDPEDIVRPAEVITGEPEGNGAGSQEMITGEPAETGTESKETDNR